MIYIQLFLSFLKIGAFSFGGGMGMISLLRESVLSHSWMSEEELMNFIAVSESTPGSIAVNMATFVGSSQGGILGSFVSTLGVVLPSFLVILLIASVFSSLAKHKVTQEIMDGIRPAIVGMILATSIIMGGSLFIDYGGTGDSFDVRWRGVLILLLLIAVQIISKKVWKKKLSPILMIILSAILGIFTYSCV